MSAGRQVAFAASVSILNPHALLDTVAVIGTSSIQYAGWSVCILQLQQWLYPGFGFWGLLL